MNRAREILEAQRLRASGATLRALGERFGISLSTASTWVRSHPCADCGGPVTKLTAARCHQCANVKRGIEEQLYWTRERISEAITMFFVEHGRAPTTQDWARATGTTPNRNQVKRRYGTWNAAIQAADLTPRKRGGRGPSRGPNRLSLVAIAPTVANGFAASTELEHLIAEQAEDAQRHVILRRDLSIDSEFHHVIASLRSANDEWLEALCERVDRERELDEIAAEYLRGVAA